MKKFLWKTITITAFLSCMASGYQNAPEISSAGSIPHAKDSMEGQIEDIVNSSEPGSGICRDTDPIRCLIGKEENGVRIEAPAPYIPEHIYHMVLTANDGLTMNRLESFLESPSGGSHCYGRAEKEVPKWIRPCSLFA